MESTLMSINISTIDNINEAEEAVEHLNLVDKECPNCKVKVGLWKVIIICESKQGKGGTASGLAACVAIILVFAINLRDT